MQWIKKGLIFCSNGNYKWNITHAQTPIAKITDNNIIRIYYASRDLQNKSRISYIEVEAENPTNIVCFNDGPVLELGKIGTFDDSGMMPTCVIQINNKFYLYYIGWNIRNSVPYHNSIGLAISQDDGKTFLRFSDGPIIDRTYKEPYFSGTAYILKEKNTFKMWYLSCIKWELVNDKQEPFYHIKYAESEDGINWKRDGKVAIELKENEGGIASASVCMIGSLYYLWYSYRGIKEYRTNKKGSYKIGLATSKDGLVWERKDNEVGITLSEEGWDSQMMAYPNVIRYKNKLYMFYNGNGFGKTGFGYAVLEE